ncbi:VOC family protein [Microbacterium insulae]
MGFRAGRNPLGVALMARYFPAMESPHITDQRAYPPGAPSWIDLATTDPHATCDFYAGLFEWSWEEVGDGSYWVARLDGHDVAAARREPDDDGWMSYVATDDVDALAASVEDAGGTVIDRPADVGAAGRGATLADPDGARFRGWRAGNRLGAQLVNMPGAWNFSILHTPDRARSMDFYGGVFGWRVDAALGAGMIRLPGYGDHLESTIDPGIRERQAFAPEGFEDVVAGLSDIPAGPARWVMMFTVADRDEAVERAVGLGATVVSTQDSEWTQEAELLDVRGSAFVVSALVKTE